MGSLWATPATHISLILRLTHTHTHCLCLCWFHSSSRAPRSEQAETDSRMRRMRGVQRNTGKRESEKKRKKKDSRSESAGMAAWTCACVPSLSSPLPLHMFFLSSPPLLFLCFPQSATGQTPVGDGFPACVATHPLPPRLSINQSLNLSSYPSHHFHSFHPTPPLSPLRLAPNWSTALMENDQGISDVECCPFLFAKIVTFFFGTAPFSVSLWFSLSTMQRGAPLSVVQTSFCASSPGSSLPGNQNHVRHFTVNLQEYSIDLNHTVNNS